MYNPINGWTKQSMIAHIQKNFRGRSTATIELQDHIKSNICAYRGEEGRKCAVGMFIPDEKYSAKMENVSGADVINRFGLTKDMPLDNFGMSVLQGIHDQWYKGTQEEIDKRTLEHMLNWIEFNVEDADESTQRPKEES